jgi:hypothetical protein
MRSVSTLLAFTVLSAHAALAQKTFNDIEYVDVGNIKAALALHGDLWWDPSKAEARCEFPKGSGKHVSHVSALWFSGYDLQGQLRTAAQTYRQTGNDIWPGPVPPDAASANALSESWARVWKVNKSDINAFRALSTHTLANTPAPILEWPAKNNTHAKGKNGATLTITTAMAPFVDVNGDGNYDALAGDYPDIKGDQMLWWIFNDATGLHANSQTENIMMEVRAKAYAYNSGTLANIIFYEYEMTNTSNQDYSGFRCGLWTDVDLGYYNDDYIGFDSTRRMGMCFNGNAYDGIGAPTGEYHDSPPIMGVALLELPGDNATTKVPAGSFMYFNNDNSVSGNPKNGTEYNYYLRSTFRDGQHLHNDFTPGVPSTGRGAGPDATYVYSGDPTKNTEWSECAAGNLASDRRFVLASNDFDFPSKSTKKFAFALVITDTSHLNNCDSMTLNGITALADTAIRHYTITPATGVGSTVKAPSKLQVYPNPANDAVYVNVSGNKATVQVYDVTGRQVPVQVSTSATQIRIGVSHLARGMYHIIYSTAEGKHAGAFIKE